MGPGVKPRRDTAPDPDIPQHAQIVRLRDELDTCAMKIAQLQARLIATQDERDQQRSAYQRELTSERRAKEKLSHTLDRYLDEVKRAERERDDLRELVSILVDKAPLSEQRPLDPLHETRDSIEVAIAALLRQQLTEEKRAHARTKQETDAEILRLRAMIARRDAELEACAVHDAHRILLSSSVPSDGLSTSGACTRPNCMHGRATHHHPPAPGSELPDADSVLARATSRNRLLEREVEILRQTVHQVQHSQSSGANTVDARSSRVRTPEKRHVSVKVQTINPVPLNEAQYPLPPSPELLPYTMPSPPSPYALTPQYARSPTQTQTPMQFNVAHDWQGAPPQSVDIQHLKRDVDVLSVEIDGFMVERAAVKAMLAHEMPQAFPEPPRRAGHKASPAASGPHVIDECIRERQELRDRLRTITSERARRERELEAEIASLRHALQDLRRDLAARPSLQQQSNGPAGELRVPAAALSPRVSPTLVPADARALPMEKAQGDVARASEREHHDWEGAGDYQRITSSSSAEVPEEGDQDELGEQSMELATPLQTTTILSLREDDWPMPPSDYPAISARPPAEAELEPADIPLPTSPDTEPIPAASSPALSSVLVPSSPSPPPLYVAPPHVPADLLARIESATSERVATIEREIAATARELEEKEAALMGLHHQLDRRPSYAQGAGR